MKRFLIFSSICLAIVVAGFSYYKFLPMEKATADNNSTAMESVVQSDNNFEDAGPYKVHVSINPSVPKVGKNEVVISVNDDQGKPVSQAKIKAVAVMPAMGSMPAMYAPSELTEIEAGKYQGQFQPSMAGEWPMTIDINSAAGNGSITYDLAIGREGIRCATCGGSGMEMPGTVRVDAGRRQLIGITTGKVKEKKLRIPIRAAGRITYDETRLTDITLKFNGWIGDLYADALGKSVSQGEPLFTVYSPDLLAAQEEYLETRKRIKVDSLRGKKLLNAARRRLLLWSLTKNQISQLENRGHALEYIPILSPINGVIINKSIVKGSSFKPGQQLFRIADLNRVWVEADVYDADLALIKTGMKAKVVLHEMDNHTIKTKVDYIYPYMANQTRTGKIRLLLDNSEGLFRPDMFVQVKLKVKLSKRLVVPESAVMYAGDTRLVFLDLGDGRLQPQKIQTGNRNRKWIEVVGGLEKGDQVVTSGNFLIASESKLKSGVQQW